MNGPDWPSGWPYGDGDGATWGDFPDESMVGRVNDQEGDSYPPSGADDAPNESKGENLSESSCLANPSHAPGPGGVLDSRALCGATAGDGVLRMHVWEYDCADCRRLSGEAGWSA